MRSTTSRALSAFIVTLAMIASLTIIKPHRFFAQQPNRQSQEVRSLNDQLLQVYARLVSLPNPQAAAAVAERSQAATVIQQRAAALKALIRQNPSEALSLALSEDLLSRLRNAFPESAHLLESAGSWEGPIEYLIEDGADLKTHREHHHMAVGGETLNVHFASNEPADLKSGKILRVAGVRAGTEIAADSGAVTGTATGSAAMCTSVGEQRSIVLLVNMPGTPTPTITQSSVHDIFFANPGPSVSDFWRENSYGQAWAQGDVAGWFTLDANYTCNQTNEIRDAAIRAADATVDFTQYSRIFLVVSGISGSCGWAGVGTVGCSWLSSAGDGAFIASTSWLSSTLFDTREHGVKLSIHEGGHNLGLNHAASRDFGYEALGAPGVVGTLNEYGDEYSTLGAWTMGHYAAPHKAMLGWLTSDVQTVTANGSFSVQPVEASGALHALKIRRGIDNNNWLWVEYRNPIGIYDSTVNPFAFGGGLIHYEDPNTGIRTHALDFTPDTDSWSDPVLVPGKSWSDPYTNTSLAIDSSSSDALSLTVGYGPMSCINASPTVSLSPLNPSAYPGDSVAYTIAVLNNDTTACAPRSFDLSSLVPAWVTSFSQNSIVLAPSATASATMSKVVPLGTAPATYSVDAIVSTENSSIDRIANVTVMPACIVGSPTITLSASTQNAYPGDQPVYTVTVTNNDTAMCSARTFTLSSVSPTSWPTVFSAGSLSVAPGSTGSATMTKTVPTSTLPGNYFVDATAASNATSASASTNLTVQAPQLSVVVSISGGTSIFSKNSTVPITAKVMQGSAAVAGASVQFTMRYPDGATSTKRITADSTGQAGWNYRIGQRDPKGIYQIFAQVKSGSQTATSTSVSFSVQ